MLKRIRYLVSQLWPIRFYKCRIAPLMRFFQFVREWGALGALSFCSSLLLKRGEHVIRLSCLKRPLHMRLGTSDVTTLIKIFFRLEYDVPLDFEPDFIIDAGANVGYSSVYFANRYPDADIIAVEPEDTNYTLLKKNCSPYENIRPLRGGLWSKSVTLKISNLVGGDKAGYMVEETDREDKAGFRSYTISEILQMSGHDSIGILKMDIEGAEKEVFSADADDWVGNVGAIFAELHDYMVAGCRKAMEKAVEGKGFKTIKRGENVILVRSWILH